MVLASVIIINWNGVRYLRDCIGSVQRQSVSPFELIIIDNDSDDESREILRQESVTRVVLNDKNIGFSAACNQGIKNGKSECVLIMNSDVVLDPNYLEVVLQTMKGKDNIGMVSGKVFRFDQKTIDSCGQTLGKNRRAYERGYGQVDRNQFDRREKVFSVCGALALYRREMLEDVAVEGEYFDESFFAFYEDIDLGWRAQNAGWKAYFTPEAVAYHYRGGTNASKPVKIHFWNRYEFMRRPRDIQAHIVINRYLMIIKNDNIFYFLRDLPFILSYEMFLWGYILLFRPILIWDTLKRFSSFGKAYRKRTLMKRKKTLLIARG